MRDDFFSLVKYLYGGVILFMQYYIDAPLSNLECSGAICVLTLNDLNFEKDKCYNKNYG